MGEECLICKAPLEYLQEDIEMECAVCHKKEYSKTRCIHGHYVCNECHTSGMDRIISVCLHADTKNPVRLLEKMMSMDFCHMHGPEHHVMVGAALLTAFKNAGGKIDLEKCLSEMYRRGKSVPGGACGFWGACGAGISAGMYISIVTGATPLAGEAWGLSNQMTSRALGKIGEVGGPRCCKRDSYLAITEAVQFTKEKLGIVMEADDIVCSRSEINQQCIKERCPFFDRKIVRGNTEKRSQISMKIADKSDLEDLVALRVEMQIEDWERTLNQDFSGYAQKFGELTRRHLEEKLGESIFFAILYEEQEPVSCCALEEVGELPQITVCTEPDARHGCLASVYTKPAYRERGYQQRLLGYLMDYVRDLGFHDITLTTNSPDAAHIYLKYGFTHISEKYFLAL